MKAPGFIYTYVSSTQYGIRTHRHNAIVHMHTTVGGRRAARNQLRDVDGGVGADVRIVGAAGNGEPEPGGAALQRDVLVLPAIVAVRQLCAVRCARRVRLMRRTLSKPNGDVC